MRYPNGQEVNETMGRECDTPYCRRPGLFVHHWRDSESGKVVCTWYRCREHDYPRSASKRYQRVREADGSLTQFVRVEKCE